MTISKSGFLYWKTKGETITVQLLTTGVVKQEEDGTTKRFLGKERWWHVVRGKGWQPCSRGECHICEQGHKPNRMVEMLVKMDGEPWETAVPMSLNDILVQKMEELEKRGLDPLLRSYKITKTRGRPFWVVKIV